MGEVQGVMVTLHPVARVQATGKPGPDLSHGHCLAGNLGVGAPGGGAAHGHLAYLAASVATSPSLPQVSVGNLRPECLRNTTVQSAVGLGVGMVGG